MNNKFYTYQRRDNPNCGYGMTGEVIFGGEDGREILFYPDDDTLAFQVDAEDVFGLERKKLTGAAQAWKTCWKYAQPAKKKFD